MNDKILNGKAINRLAAVLHELRPDWDEPGIVDALCKATELATDGWALYDAAGRAARDQTNRTPKVIALDGAHWRPPAPVNPKDKPAYYGPTVDFCTHEIAGEDGQPRQCRMLLHPDEPCTHGRSLTPAQRRAAIQRGRAQTKAEAAAEMRREAS